jgi:putative addiction module killer protein
MEVQHYQTATGVEPVRRWLDALEDRKVRAAVLRRFDRLARGLTGDSRFCAGGVWELRIDVGPGYRIYYATFEPAFVLLLCAGTKKSQTRDIESAEARLRDYKERRRRRTQ